MKISGKGAGVVPKSMKGDTLLTSAMQLSRKLEAAGIKAKVRLDAVGSNRMVRVVTANPQAAYKAITGKAIQLRPDNGMDYSDAQDPNCFMTTIGKTTVYLMTPAEDRSSR